MNLVYTTKCSGFLSFRSPESICPTRSRRDRKREIVPSTVFPSKGKLGAFTRKLTQIHVRKTCHHMHAQLEIMYCVFKNMVERKLWVENFTQQ